MRREDFGGKDECEYSCARTFYRGRLTMNFYPFELVGPVLRECRAVVEWERRITDTAERIEYVRL